MRRCVATADGRSVGSTEELEAVSAPTFDVERSERGLRANAPLIILTAMTRDRGARDVPKK